MTTKVPMATKLSMATKVPMRFEKYPIPYTALRVRKPFRACFYRIYLSQFRFFFYLGTPSTSVPTSNPSCSTSSAVANASDLQLTDREKARLDELFMASRALVEPVEHERDVRNSIFYISSVGQG